MPDDEEPTDEELIQSDEETDATDGQRQSWLQKRRDRKKDKQQQKINRQLRDTQEQYSRFQQQEKIRQMRQQMQSPGVKRVKELAREMAVEGSQSFGKTGRYVRETGRRQARRYTRSGVRRQQRIPAVARQGVTSTHDASAPTGMELGIAMEFGQPREQREYTSHNRQDLFSGGQGGQVERGTVPAMQPTPRPVIVKPQVQETTRPMDFFGTPQNRDFFGLSQNKDFFGSNKKTETGINKDILGKRKKQNFF